jgi:hypothetical protein
MLLQMDFIKQELENTEVPILLVISFYNYNVLFFHYDAGLLEVPCCEKGIKIKCSFTIKLKS